MGNPSSQSESTINHFSHPHPLHLTTHQSNQPPPCCSACKQSPVAGEFYYTCKAPPCATFSLHLKCSKLPHLITHPFHHHHHHHPHPNHHHQPLSLLEKSPYLDGFFTCDACGKQGDGFCYHCKECELDLHVLCATLPLFVTHQRHHHQLNLVFKPPYGDLKFSCDVCGEIGGNKYWLYRCDMCGFDAHLSCVMSKPQAEGRRSSVPQPRVAGNPYGDGRINGQDHRFGDFPAAQAFPRPQIGLAGGGGSRFGNNQFLQQVLMGGGASRNDQFLQALMGGGGGGGSNQLLQALMGNNGSDGGGGGAGNQFLQALMGNAGGVGGGNNELLQAMMGGGSGGGVNGDLLQALLNGGYGGNGLDFVGGGGGLDLSGLMGGGFGGFGF